jgi:FHS family L-fucose permease-like MFS transporter
MNLKINARNTSNHGMIKWLTFFMFMMFAMTTDAVGVIIPEVMKQFQLSMTAAGLMHYMPMIAIALSGVLLGFLADKLGRKTTIIIGLGIFAVNSYLYIIGHSFAFIITLMAIGGLAIGIFKTAALAPYWRYFQINRPAYLNYECGRRIFCSWCHHWSFHRYLFINTRC